MDVRFLDIMQATQLMAGGELTAVDLLSSCIDAIEAQNESMKAFIHLESPDALYNAAKDSDARRSEGSRMGPLEGIPIAIKANFACRGLPQSAGSRFLASHPAQEDAHSVRNLRRAGALILGLTNMHEFANGPTSDNPHYGRPRNPHDTQRTPGGSSGGSAVALSSGLCLGATGTDDGGSIRVPAAFCGLVGLKPTFGSVNLEGIFPFSRSLDHAGPLARNPRDVLLLFDVMRTGRASSRNIGLPKRKQTIGVDRSFFSRYLQPGVKVAFEDSLTRLVRRGYEVREISLPRLEKAHAALMAILFSEAAALHQGYLKDHLYDYSSDVRLSLLAGRLYSALDYVNAQELRSRLRGDLDEAYKFIDVIATPTAIMEAPLWEDDFLFTEEGDLDLLSSITRCTSPFDLTGHPAMSVPMGTGDLGLPVGLQLVGPYMSEPLLARVAEDAVPMDAFTSGS